MCTLNFLNNPLYKRMAEAAISEYNSEAKVSTLTIDLQPSSASGKTVWRPPRGVSWPVRIFRLLKTVVSVFYNAILAFQNGRAFVKKLFKLRI